MRRVLKPMNLELKTGHVLLLRLRQQYMRELYERDWAQERLEFKRMKMNRQSEPAHICCILPGFYRRLKH